MPAAGRNVVTFQAAAAAAFIAAASITAYARCPTNVSISARTPPPAAG